ncbi:GRF1-INTERACTING FACTOR 2 family protein [Tripterygium wilfordii]|uniref:GRF1-INTERACTING FACTOR 2 family protein n=1 Tax=Tripterygium wilfordii TaxID=458696 RepID=A0A7J7E012_TRIWF|nr:GRF1-interacting factor 3-like [Tripterygium wilfordii]KAF5751869.1 GRF1-INTERACTING FACTOR 2 family protein [Tripterygium wilfordii]
MQQTPQMIPGVPSFPPSNVTTEQIQKFLDENKKLILAILDHQNLGKHVECAQYQAQLQKNLMQLAAIADAQPPAQTLPTLMSPHPAMQQGGFYMQHPQALAMAQQHGVFPPKMPVQFNNPHQIHDPQQLHQQQQAFQMQMGMRPVGPPNNGMNPMHSEATLGGSSGVGPTSTAGPNDVRGGSTDTGTTGTGGHGNSAAGHGGDGDSSH